MVKTIPEKIDDDILVYLDKCDCKKIFEDGWKTCIHTMAYTKQQCTCETFQSLIIGTFFVIAVLARNDIMMQWNGVFT